MSPQPDNTPALKRGLGLTLITFYGLGNILGAGIYVLIGKVAAVSGMYAPFSFLVASVAAGLTALAYAELTARLPLSAGESIYVNQAFGVRPLSIATGLLIMCAGLVSAATITRGFAGYLQVYIGLPDPLIIVTLLLTLGGVAAWGITQSVRLALVFTVIELLGLLLIISAGSDHLLTLPQRLPEMLPPPQLAAWQGIMWGAFLAFYAYIGFEDMVNVAEEVRDPRHTLPRAIVLALTVSTLIYLLVSLVATLSLPPQVLARSTAPLADIYQSLTGRDPWLITQIALFAVVNGALIQLIMSSRVLYGMSHQGWLPAVLARIHPRTQTPLIATALVTAAVIVLALWLPLLTLARSTSYIVLLVFALVNASLLRIRWQQPRPAGITLYPWWVPAGGLLATVSLLLFEIVSRL